MSNITETKKNISEGAFDGALCRVYGEKELPVQRERYIELCSLFEEKIGSGEDIRFFSAPGRTEVCGNHTDHNHGRVLAAAINLDAK